MTALRINKYKVTIKGGGGLTVHIPRIQAQDMGIQGSETISMYKAVLGGRPVIILANSDAAVLDDERSQQGAELKAFIEAQEARA